MTVEITVLDNGLTVATERMEHLRTAAVAMTVQAGSRHEAESEMGVAHMLEHMAFKGTKTRTAAEIARAIENAGGALNAATSHENTVYSARILQDDLPLAVELLSDILRNSTYAEEELARERSVVISEIGEAEDTPDDIVFERFSETAFANQPLGRSILGTRDSVRGLTRDKVTGYLDRHYRSGSMILSAAGAVDHAAFCKLAERYFSGGTQGTPVPFEPATFSGGETHLSRDLDQSHLVIGFPGAATGSGDFFAGEVASHVLGGGMSSRLFLEAREKRGLCYSIYAFNWGFADTGLFGVYAGCAPEDAGDLMDVVAQESRALSEAATEEEVAGARAQLKAGLLMSMESCAVRAEHIARQLVVFGRVLTPDEIIERIDAVDVDAVTGFMRRVVDSPAAFSTVGPDGSLARLDRVAAQFRLTA